MKRVFKMFCLFTMSCLITACGGGGGDSSTPKESNEPVAVTKTFTVELSGLKVTQISSGNEIAVSSNNVSESGVLVVKQ